MGAAYFLLSLLMAGSSAAAAPEAIGIFGQWGAFSENSKRCYAIAEPEGRAREGRPFASVGFWPGNQAGGQLHLRLSRPKRAGSAILLTIGERSFQLVGGGVNAWAPDPRADAAIVAAMRGALEMAVATRSEGGALIRDRYTLRGAPSAIDAAALACATRR